MGVELEGSAHCSVLKLRKTIVVEELLLNMTGNGFGIIIHSSESM